MKKAAKKVIRDATCRLRGLGLAISRTPLLQTQANRRTFLIPSESMLAAQNVSPVMWGDNEKEMASTADISQLLDMLPEPAAERCARARDT